jgi:hypothetical protein
MTIPEFASLVKVKGTKEENYIFGNCFGQCLVFYKILNNISNQDASITIDTSKASSGICKCKIKDTTDNYQEHIKMQYDNKELEIFTEKYEVKNKINHKAGILTISLLKKNRETLV